MTSAPLREDASYIDAHGVEIHFYRWAAVQPRGVVQIAHGVGEHALRYRKLAAALVAAGYTVYADDHRGHGQTGLQQGQGRYDRLGRLGPGGLRGTITAVHQLSERIRDEHAEPLFLLGHSWGSLMAQIILNEHSGDYAGVVLSGSAYRTPLSMTPGNFNRRFRHLGDTGHEWLSRDAQVAADFRDDPLCFRAEPLKIFGVTDSLRLLGRPARNLPNTLPLLLQVGEADAVGGPKSVRFLAEAYRQRSGLRDVRVIVYPGARHEIFNETNRDEVTADLISWLAEHTEPVHTVA